MPNSQLNKLKSGIKNCTGVTLNLSSIVIVDSNDDTNFLHELLLADGQVYSLREAFANNSSAKRNIKKSFVKNKTIRTIFRWNCWTITKR